METNRIRLWITEGMEKGYSLEQLQHILIKKGFDEFDVVEASQGLELVIDQTAHKRRKPGFFKKINLAFTAPIKLFKATRPETVLSTLAFHFGFVAITMLLITLAGLGIVLTLGKPILPFVFALIPLEVILLVAGYYYIGKTVLTPLIMLIQSAIMHLFVLIGKGKGRFSGTYKAMVYSSVPIQFGFALIAAIAFALAFIPFGFMAALIIYIVAMIFLVVYSFIVQLFGLSLNHDISKLRAFVIMLVPVAIGLLLYTIAMAIFVLV